MLVASVIVASVSAATLLMVARRERYGNVWLWLPMLLLSAVVAGLRTGLDDGGLLDFMEVLAGGCLLIAVAAWDHPMRLLPDDFLPDPDSEEESALRARVRRRASWIAIPVVLVVIIVASVAVWNSPT